MERRVAPRFPLQLTARITAVSREPADIPARTTNISRVGVLLLSARTFPAGTTLELVVNLHAELHLRLFFKGKVVWVQPPVPQPMSPGEEYCIAIALEEYEFLQAESLAANAS